MKRLHSPAARARGEPDAEEAARPVRGTGGETNPPRGRHRASVRSHIACCCVNKVRRGTQNETLGHAGKVGRSALSDRQILLAGYE